VPAGSGRLATMAAMSDARVAVVTGSASGIGAAVATRMAAAGLRVVVNSARSVQAGQALAAQLPQAHYVQADIAVQEQARHLIDAAVDRFGRLDVLVNNAGTTRFIPHHDLDAATPDIWREILGVNVVGTWQTTVAAVPHLRATGAGSVVNVSSLAGSRPGGSSIPYAASKAAVNHLTRLLASVLGPQIRVNAVAPGLVDTPWIKDYTGVREHIEGTAPLRRIGTADDIAKVICDVADATYMTGEVVGVDGGFHLR
jgi:ketoreductase RED2